MIKFNYTPELLKEIARVWGRNSQQYFLCLNGYGEELGIAIMKEIEIMPAEQPDIHKDLLVGIFKKWLEEMQNFYNQDPESLMTYILENMPAAKKWL